MSTVGIVCEYNPFHKGHEYQIQQAKLLTGAEHVICFMSGNFLQRGVPAIADKHTRTEIALRCGVDAVFEIPFVYASSSARDYAHAAVCMMNALDGIDYISFGAECDDMDLLQKIAELTVNEPPQVSEFIKKSVSSGISYGSARAAAISEYLQNQNLTGYTSADLDRILASPNNILAIEYIATLIQTDSRIKPVPIRRILSEYNSTATDNDICSASAIRELLRSGDVESLRRHIPDSCYNICKTRTESHFRCSTTTCLISCQHEGYLLRARMTSLTWIEISATVSPGLTQIYPLLRPQQHLNVGIILSRTFREVCCTPSQT